MKNNNNKSYGRYIITQMKPTFPIHILHVLQGFPYFNQLLKFL